MHRFMLYGDIHYQCLHLALLHSPLTFLCLTWGSVVVGGGGGGDGDGGGDEADDYDDDCQWHTMV